MKKYIGFLVIFTILAINFSVVSADSTSFTSPNYKAIKIISPNNGGTFDAGEIINVKWKTKNVSYMPRVVIDIIKFGLPVGSLGYPLDEEYSINDGHEKFVLNDNLETGYYSLRIRLVNSNRVYDISNKPIYVQNLGDFYHSPVITGVAGPQSLITGQTGTWEVEAYDPNGGNLSYSVDWGEHLDYTVNPLSAFPKMSQTTTFTHRYNRSGNYTITFTVTNEDGESETTSMTVNVNNGGWGNVLIAS